MAASTDKVILNSMLVTVGSTVSFSLAPTSMGGSGQFPPPRLLIGTGLAYMGLGILGDIAPGVARPLAIVMAVTALTYYGLPLMDNVFTNKGAK
jgi:hypothetical protein